MAWLFVSYCNSVGGATLAVVGGIIGVLISTLPATVWGLHWTWKNYGAKPDFGVSAKIFVASVIASVATYMFIGFITLPGYLLTLVGGFIIFLLVFIVSAPLLGAINTTDIENFRAMFSNLGVISKFLYVPLIFMLKVTKIYNGNNGRKVLTANE